MSTSPPPTSTTSKDEIEIKIVSHSNLFYWWPVWFVGFLMALLTWFDGHQMVIVPTGTQLGHGISGKISLDKPGESLDIDDRAVLVAPKGFKVEQVDPPHLHMAKNKNYGVMWSIVLILVILITNVPLRGMWSVVTIVVIVLMSVIFGLAGLWEVIFGYVHLLHIQINAGGYLFISLLLFVIWLVTFVFFDQQLYMIFTPGQLKVRTEIGGGEKAFDTTGMTIEKQRSDLFRHWILGLGSGDLIVNTAGAAVHHFDLPNVLFIGKKVQQIEDMMKRKAVVETR